MITRRQIRIKVLQALYAFYQDAQVDMRKSIKDLDKNMQRIYELYTYELLSLVEIHKFAEDRMERNKLKHLPTAEDLQPNTRFIDNRVLQLLANSRGLAALQDKYKASWADNREIFRKSYLAFAETPEFLNFMSAPEVSFSDEKALVKHLYGFACLENEDMGQFYEEKNIFWSDDLHDVQMMVLKTLKNIKEHSDESFAMVPLFKDEDDAIFGETLFQKTILHNDQFENMIADAAKNWDVERIAFIDQILMKMALAELIYFPEVPIRVTLNEVIEISKNYSTPKSSKFINGILDKLSIKLQADKTIQKVGRGLL